MGRWWGHAIGSTLLVTTLGCAASTGVPDPADGQVPSRSALTGSPAQTPSPTTTPTTHTSVTATTTHTSVTATAAPTRSATTAATTPTPTTPEIHDCAAPDLTASTENPGLFPEDHEQKTVTRVLLRNAGHSPCRLSGWAGLTFYGSDVVPVCVPGALPDTQSCATPETRPNERRRLTTVRSQLRPPSAVVLSPGHSTSFDLLWLSSFAAECVAPVIDSPLSAEIRVPGDARPIALPKPRLQPCDGLIGVTTFGTRLTTHQ
ncbi:DUF4232 domain-containing protein [Streptomyces lushanensis]|uniref:DUF4232 domain-containing protein n=1 Tax=Streptomyces lushanensis TaxID=1434255 RepID=UPI0009A00AA5